MDKYLFCHIFFLVCLISCEELNEITTDDKIHVLYQDILQQFDVISKNINVKENINLRKIRSILLKPKKCSISHDKLQGLKKAIDLSLWKAEVTQENNSNCKYSNDTNADNCFEMVKLIQCGIDELKNKFLEYSNKSNLDEITKWENAYNDLNARYQEDVDSLQQQFQQKHRIELDKLTTSLQNLHSMLNQMQNLLKNQTMKLCISELANDKTQNAANLFINSIKDDSKLKEIIKTCYNDYGDLSKVVNVVKFVRLLPFCTQDSLALRTLFDLMKKNEQLNNPEILILAEASQQCLNATDFLKDMNPHVQHVIKVWANKIRGGNFEEVLNITKNQPSFYRNYIESLIKKSYDNNPNYATTILSFIEGLAYLEDAILGMKSLYQEMKNSNHLDSYDLILLGIDIRTLMEDDNYDNVGLGYRIQLQTIKNSLPSHVVRLIWNGVSCTIRNRWFNEYMYTVMDHLAHDYDRRYVFTWVPKNPVWQGNWKIEFNFDVGAFTLKNLYHNEYLYSVLHPEHYDFNCKRRIVFTWRRKELVYQGYWMIIPSDEGTHFKLRNTLFNEDLYAVHGNINHCYRTFYDNDRRYVFTSKSCNSLWCQWEIDC